MADWIARHRAPVHLAILDGCCGQGGTTRGLVQAGHEVWGVDSDLSCRDGYLRSGGQDFIQADILDVLSDPKFLRRFDAVVVGPPCFPAETPVTTARGVLPISSVRIGDLVLTHQGRWRPVTKIMSRTAPVYADGWLAATADHSFWACEQIRQQSRGVGQGKGGRFKGPEQEKPCDICGHPTTSQYGVCEGNKDCRREYASRINKWSLSKPSWVRAGDLHGKFVAMPAVAEPLPIPAVPGRRTSRGAPVTTNSAFWWMIGRWVGDGWLRTVERDSAPSVPKSAPSRLPGQCLNCGEPTPKHARYPHLWNAYCSHTCSSIASRHRRAKPRNEVIICCGVHEAAGLASKLADTGLHWTRSTQRTTIRFQTAHAGLARWLEENFGHGAQNKTVPGWLLGADIEVRQALLDGYISADGHDYLGGQRITTTSTGLAFGIRQLATTLGHTSTVSLNTPPKTIVIEGRTVNQRPWWSVAITPDDGRYTRVDALHRWVKRRHAMTLRGAETVYDLTVDEDHSFIAWGFAVHNCQGYSQMSRCRPGLAATYPRLIAPVRELLLANFRGPWVIENVGKARPEMLDPMTLCMWMFGREGYRHRLIEAGGGLILQPPPAPAEDRTSLLPARKPNRECGWIHPVAAAKAGHWEPGKFVSVSGHERKEPVRRVMEIGWMSSRDAVKEAIPPYMAQWVGEQLANRSAA